MPTIAYQLYCSRNFPPLPATLRMLSETGYKAVEGYGGLYDALDDLKAGLDATGLAMPSGHFGLEMVEQDPARAVAVARALGVKKVFVPYIVAEKRPGDAAGWAAFGRRLAEAGKPVQDAGLAYGWHNHDFELADLGGGVTPLDLIAEAGVDLELDLGWVRVAGHDPAALIARHAGRIRAVHVKDIAPAGTAADEDGWADVGHGIIDWAPVKAALDAAGVDHFVIEHDNPKDHARFAARSLAAVSGWKGM
jgi:sugar phosphate isomerase/epimerase